MQFVYPAFLFALAAIAIPIIIHLFHFRRFKKVYFSNVKFLKEVKEESASRSRLRNLLVLFMRIMAVAFLVFAFAQPFIPQKDTAVKAGQKAVSLYVDNSFSMDARASDVPLVEKAKQRAREIVSAYNVDDEFQIITCDFEGRHQRLVSQEDALQLIDEIQPSYSVKELSKVIAKQRQALNTAKAETKVSYLISDFQKNITDLETVQDTTVEMNLVPLQSVELRNVSIDSCWFEAPVQMLNQTNRLIVKMSNLSDEEVEDMRLSLKLDGQVKPLGNLNLAPNETIYDTVNVTIIRTGWHEAELMITDYPVNFDDRYFFAFNVQKEIKVLAINETAANRYLSAAFGNAGYFKVDNEMSNKIDYSKLSEYQLIVLNELNTIPSGLAFELKQYIADGGNVGIFPNKNANISTYKSFLNSVGANELTAFQTKQREVTYINVDEFIFNDVFINKNSNLKLPSTTGNFGATRNRAEEVLLRYRDGGSYISKYVYEGGNLFLSAAPLNKEVNSLVQNGEVFVPLLYKMALATGKDTRIAYVIGKDDVLESDNKITGSEIVYKLKGSAEEFIPGQKALGNKVILNINNQIKTAGFYNLFLDDSETLYKFAFNYDRRESQLAYFSEAELKEKGGQFVDIIEASANADFKELIGERSRGIILWKWCLIAALLFLLAEVLLLRFWKA
jgi:hypothetical protein